MSRDAARPAPVGLAAGRGERTRQNQRPKPLEHRAAQRQLAGLHRAAQRGAPKVDTVKGGGVDPDLEVDVESGMLETNRDLRGLSTIQ